MNVLIGGGFGMSILDGSAWWTLGLMAKALGHDVRLRECLETGTHKMLTEDVQWADIFCVYSYGTATLWKRLFEIGRPPKQCKALAVVAGVNDILLLQGSSVWHIPDFFTRAICWQVDDIPQSHAIKNTGAIWTNVLSPLPPDRYLNINCNNLFPTILPPGDKHKAIKERQDVLASVASLF